MIVKAQMQTVWNKTVISRLRCYASHQYRLLIRSVVSVVTSVEPGIRQANYPQLTKGMTKIVIFDFDFKIVTALLVA